MPTRRPDPPASKPPHRGRGFRERYDRIEAQRAALIERLTSLGEAARRHPAHRRALTLLNATFRRATLAQRLAILQAAAWLIDVLERLTTAA